MKNPCGYFAVSLVLLTGCYQQRRAFTIGVIQHAHRIAESAANMQIHDAQRPRSHGVTIRHRHYRDFLQSEDVLKPPISD